MAGVEPGFLDFIDAGVILNNDLLHKEDAHA